jgi:hypothetical protein
MLVVYTEHCEPIGDAEGAFSASLQAAYRRFSFRGNPVGLDTVLFWDSSVVSCAAFDAHHHHMYTGDAYSA